MRLRCSQPLRLPTGLIETCHRLGLPPSRDLLIVSILDQTLCWLQRAQDQIAGLRFPRYLPYARFRISSSRLGVGQVSGSNRTPLGLHRIAAKIGGGQPIGTVFKSRQPVGLTWRDCPNGLILHRILWLEGLEPGFNQGGEVDSYSRYIYLHGYPDETTLGRPASEGCLHLAAADLIPAFDRLPLGTWVWLQDPRLPSSPPFGSR